jgi:hypothetical protein
MSSNANPSEPPYRIEMRSWGIGEPHQRPVGAFKVHPSGQVDFAMPDEVALWRYVEYLETLVQRLGAGVGNDTARVGALEDNRGAIAPTKHPTKPPLGALQARAQDANAPDTAEITSDTAERALRDTGAPEVVLGMLTTNAPETEATAATLRERVIRALMADATQTNGSIAQTCDCSDEYVRLRRRELEAEGQLSPVPVRRADGTLYSRCGAE